MGKLWYVPVAIVGVLILTLLVNYVMRFTSYIVKEIRMTFRVFWQTSRSKKRYEDWHQRNFHKISKIKRGLRAWRYSHSPLRVLFQRR